MFTGKKLLSNRFLPVFVFGLSCLFLILLLSTIKRDVFFSSDGGLKYLMARQNTHSPDQISLQHNTKSWVDSIWKQGFYPFKEPFVYDGPGLKIVSFPPFFQQLTAPLYALAGYTGLYCIPVVSLLLLWVWFVWLLHRLRIRPQITAAALFCLAFCSPLTVYAAIYWEHTLAILLLFGAIVFFIKPVSKPFHALALGCMSAFAGWLRPEALWLSLLITGLVLYNLHQQKNKNSWYFITGQTIIITLFFICNRYLYGDFLGAHSYQLFTDISFKQKIYQSLIVLTHINGRQLLFFPVSFFVFAIVFVALWKKEVVPRSVSQLLIIVLLFSLTAPFFLPNAGGKQWGPRYFLALIPIVLIVAAIFVNTLSFTGRLIKTGVWLLIPVVVFSMYLNGFTAFRTLHDDYAFRVKPCLNFVEHDACNVIVVQNQYIALELAAVFHTKNIFLAEDMRHYTRLQKWLKQAQVQEVIFISRDKELLLPCDNSQAGVSDIRHIGDYYLTRCKWPL